MSNERKIQTRTVVTVSIEVHTCSRTMTHGPRGSIHRRATESAMNTIACLNRPDLRVVGDPQVRMVITEGGNG
jgi:hypothetical protein